jgi:ABC-type Mn/Zn transport systems, ATPase component
MNEALVEIRGVDAGYEKKVVLKDISLDIFRNDFLGIIGPNGGGKTTLLKLILGLIKPNRGEIRFTENELKNKIGYMPQTNQIDRKFPILVHEVIRSGLISEKGRTRTERVRSVMESLELIPIGNKAIGELSGGQLQRVLLARAIVDEPKLLILDEPNSYVDKKFESLFYEKLRELNMKTAIILVSHDVGTVISMVKNIACVNENLFYHPGADVNHDWLEAHFACPFDLLGHGNLPHRILKSH